MIYNSLQAIIDGFKDGGVDIVTNYPGVKSEKVFEGLGGKIVSINEKIAYQIAYGVSLAGQRALVTMKNAGLNVASDPYLNSLISGVNGGLVLLVIDDTYVSSSQSRQDSRHYLDFFGGICLEPSSLQMAYDFAYKSFQWSEELDFPVIIRLTSPFWELSNKYKRRTPIKRRSKKLSNKREKYLIHPWYWKKQFANLQNKNLKVQAFTTQLTKKCQTTTNYEFLEIQFGCKGITSSKSTLKFNCYPIPLKNKNLKKASSQNIPVYEQGDNYASKKIIELYNEQSIVSHFGEILDLSKTYRNWRGLRKLFIALKEIDPSYVVGDLTQFTKESTNCINSCLCLGSAVSIAIGLSEAKINYPFCVTGDSSLLHGYLGVFEAIERKSKFGLIVIENGGAWCTGGQPTTINIHSISPDIRSKTIKYSDTTIKEFKAILKDMRKSNQLSILYVKYDNKDG